MSAEFTQALDADTPPAEMKRHVTVEKNHGRKERREYYALPAPKRLPGLDLWKNLRTLVMVVRITEVDGVEKGQVSYFLSSRPAKIKSLARLIRQHWKIESMHWVLDVTFTEDASRIRKQNAPQTCAMLRRLAVSILSSDTYIKDNVRGKRYRASLSTEVLERLLLSFVEK